MNFEKWQALGNDYLIVERDRLPWPLSAARVQRLCDAHFGPGADGVLELAPPDDAANVAALRIFNPDGSQAELSGNGAREAILYLRRRGWTDADAFGLETPAGVVRPVITSADTCRVDMGRAATASPVAFPSGQPDGRGTLIAAAEEVAFQFVSIGNPQCAVAVASAAALAELDLGATGGAIEAHELFPQRTNVSFYAVGDKHRIRARIFERGVGETLSSGTGASGAAVAHVLAGGASPVTVELDGGELQVEVGADLRVHLTGWARPVYSATLSEELIEELR